MDFVNQTFSQLRDLFESMTPGARITAGLLLAVVVVSLGFLFQQSNAGPDEYLFGGEAFSQSQIARMEAAMATAGIEGFQIEGNKIRVPRSQKMAAIAAIADAAALPPDVHRLMSKALDGGSVFDSGTVKKQRIQAAREQQLSHIITLMPWVEQAIVIYDEQASSGLRRARQASVVVSVMPDVGESLTSKRSRNLKAFASKAYNVSLESVQITNLGGEASFASDGIDPDDFENPFYQLKAKIEKGLRGDLLEYLGYIPGVRVQVKAVMDDTMTRRTIQTKPESVTATLQQTSIEETTKRTNGAGGGQPGLEAQGPGRNGVDAGLAGKDQSETSLIEETSQNVVGSQTEETTHYGAMLKEATASIAVPRSFVKQDYRDRYGITDETEEIAKDQLEQYEQVLRRDIENIVEPLLPELSLGEDEYKQVKVGFFFDAPKPEMVPPSTMSNALSWGSRYGNTMAMAGLAIFSLVMLRSIVNSTNGNSLPPGRTASLQLEGIGGNSGESHRSQSAEDDDDDGTRPKLKLRKADTLKDDLADMVSGDPDAAAAILRSWINNAG